MNNALYFLSIIARAVSAPDPEPAFKKAIQDIITLGGKPGFETGYRQFRHFMVKIIEQWEFEYEPMEEIQTAAVKDLALQLAAGIFEGDSDETRAAYEVIFSRKTWRECFRNLCTATSKYQKRRWLLELVVSRNGNRIGSYSLEHTGFSIRIGSALPGFYGIELNTGRNLWQGEITKQDLLWASAFPQRDIKLAADTEGSSPEPSRIMKLLDGELIVQIFPAIESGWIQIERKILN